MKKILINALACALSYASFSGLAHAQKTISLDSTLMQAIDLKTAPVVAVNQYLSQPFPAQAAIPLGQTHLVTTPVGGLIQQIYYLHGPIEKGAVIADILSPELLNLQKTYLNTLADFQLADQELKRAQQLAKSGVASVKRLQEAQSAREKLQQVLEQQKQDLRLVGMSDERIQTLTKTHTLQPTIIHITAPLSGEVFDLVVKNGQRLEANQPLVSIGLIDPIYIESFIPTEVAELLTEGQAVQVTQGKQLFDAVVEHIAQFTDPTTQTVEIHLIMNNALKMTRPGQFLTIQFVFDVEQPVFKAPRSAISQLNGQDVVFVKTAEEFKPLAIEILSFQDADMTFKPLDTFDSKAFELVTQGTTTLKALFMSDEE